MNTVSRRYVSDEPELFVPTFRYAPEGSIKQGSGDIIPMGRDIENMYQMYCENCIDYYNYMVNELKVAPEQARFILPQGVMTEWVWSGSLQAWARFYNQRSDSHAQKEIQDLAHMVGDVIKPLYPVSWTALTGA